MVPFQLYRRSDSEVWWWSATIRGRRIRRSTSRTDKEDARRVAAEARARTARADALKEAERVCLAWAESATPKHRAPNVERGHRKAAERLADAIQALAKEPRHGA